MLVGITWKIRKQSLNESADLKIKQELSIYLEKRKDDSYESYIDRENRIEEIISSCDDRDFSATSC